MSGNQPGRGAGGVLAVCSGCGGDITGEYTVLGNLPFHWECLKCGKCSLQIGKDGTLYPDDMGRLVCEKCMTQQLPKCAVCNKPITDEAIVVDGKNYHSRCFKCDKCSKQLGGGTYFPQDGKHLCHECMSKKLPKCVKCSKPIQGEHMEVEGKSYHAECFKCASCNRPIRGSYYPDKGKFKCELCMMKQMPKCAKCRNPILDEAITLEGKNYHYECFVCSKCGGSIADMCYPHGSKILCESCERGWPAGPAKCACCSKPIDGSDGQESIEAEGKLFHAKCFKCEACKKLISGMYFPGKKKRILCEPCFADECPKCAWCEQAILDNWTTAEGKNYHVDCFACSTCGVPIKTEYINLQDHFVCKRCYNAKAPICRGCKKPVKGDFIFAEGKQAFHKGCFVCGACHQPIKTRYLIRNGCHTCERCCAAQDKGKVTAVLGGFPDEWAATRKPQLERELRDLLRVAPKERKKRLRALQLELHPDKQAPERRQAAQPLFLLVQEEWEATEAEEKGQQAVRGQVSGNARDDWCHVQEAWHAG